MMPLSSGSYTVVLGFVQEIKGCNRDTAWFSVIDGERPALRETSEWVECSPGRSDQTRLTLRCHQIVPSGRRKLVTMLAPAE